MNKVVTMDVVLEKITDGTELMVGGFAGTGAPLTILDAIRKKGTKHLGIIANDLGDPTYGLGKLVVDKLIDKAVVTHIGFNREAGKQFTEGTLAVEFVPQGTFAERLRAGGAGIGGFYTPTGAGTLVAEGKEVKVINDKEYIFEEPLHADIAIIKAWKADKYGNLVFRNAGINFNSVMSMAADFVIAEVEEVVEIGELDPNTVTVPGVLVDMLVLSEVID